LRATPFGLRRYPKSAHGRDHGHRYRSHRCACLCLGFSGIAGVALSQIDNVSPNLGQSYVIDSFMVAVFGGVGNL
jgi:ribose/xylose/arabinose/galactoside ABC-type transport system permease subunit